MKYIENNNALKALNYLENSFLKELLEDDEITDISFNGESIYYVHNLLGRKKANISFSNEMAKDFLRQLSNLSEKQFSYQSPLLNISIGKYRINGVFNSIGRLKNNKVFTFSIRKASNEPRINKNSSFLTKELISLFKTLLDNNISLIIAGVTGSGKTELQKFLLSLLKENTRVIVIDEVLELDNLHDPNFLDISIWQVDSGISISQLVKNGLRSNPDWLIVSESRGEEMRDVLSSAMTGHPIITTIHSFDIESVPSRAVGMLMQSEKKVSYETYLKDFTHHIKIGIYVKKSIKENGEIIRYISHVGEFKENGDISMIYLKDNGKNIYFKLSENILNLIDLKTVDKMFLKTFVNKEEL